jgi:hypothetical protein
VISRYAVVRELAVVCKFAVAMKVIDRLLPTVVEVDVPRAHRSYTATPEQQCFGVLVVVVAPGFERFVVLGLLQAL